jgi:stage IV sporulation protein FB
MMGLGRLYLFTCARIPVYAELPALVLVFIIWHWYGSSGVGGFLIALIVLLGSILAHEFGHALVARSLGARDTEITISAFGGLCTARRDHSRPWSEIAILAAGPAVSIALAAAGWGLAEWLRGQPGLGGDLRPGLLLLVLSLLWMNVALAIFNLLPLFPLDGGQIAYHLLRLALRREALAATCALGLACLTAAAYLGWELRSGPLDPYSAILVGLLLLQAFVHLRR